MSDHHLILVDRSGFKRLPAGAKTLYEIVFPNGKRYFGITNNPKKRRQSHKTDACCGSKYPVHRALRRYRFDVVIFRIIAVGPAAYIAELEAAVVAAFDTRNRAVGYNILPGGERNPMDVPEIAKRVGRLLTGRKRDPEVTARQKAWWTPERRAEVSQQHKGKTISEAHRKRLKELADERRGRPLPPRRDHRQAALEYWERRRNSPHILQ